MVDDTASGALPQATVESPRRSRLSAVWIVPVLAILVGGGIAIRSALNEGPVITIVFTDAEGIEAGKTFIKYKDVNIGQVSSVQLTPGFDKVEVRARIDKSAAGLIVEDASFWVVRPRVTLSGVSGLSTVLAGNYIGLATGKSQRAQTSFTGLEVPPIDTGTPGRQFLIKAPDLASLGTGSPVYYRRLQVGQVVAYDLAADGSSMNIKVFVDAPYDKFVSPGTRFWNASGVDVSLGADGVNVRTQSLVSVMAGGLAFDTPAFAAQGGPAPAGQVFSLYPDQAAAMKQEDAVSRRFLLYFDESVRGLSVGGPVMLMGLPVGNVTEVGLTYDPTTLAMRPRVAFVLFPERLVASLPPKERKAAGAQVKGSEESRNVLIQRLVEERGLRAQLRSGSMVTGQLFVALEFFPKAPKAKLVIQDGVPQIPVMPGALTDLENKLAGIVAKIDRIPLEEIGNNLNQDLVALKQTLDKTSSLLGRVDSETLPGFDKTLESARNTLSGADRMIGNIDQTLLGPDAPAQQELRIALQELTQAARSLRALIDDLERHPESLIRGKPQPSSGGR
jgi:paraquat-inducible protein B